MFKIPTLLGLFEHENLVDHPPVHCQKEVLVLVLASMDGGKEQQGGLGAWAVLVAERVVMVVQREQD
jgi:hypothetical protein